MGPYCVYKHTSPSGKVYIGITSINPLKRWKKGNGYRSNQHFWRSICAYGWDAFTHEILMEGLSKEEASEAEMKLIEKYKSNDPEHGYNITAGGEVNILPESSLEKIRRANKGHVFSAETRERMSLSRKELLKRRPELAATRKGSKMDPDHKKRFLAAGRSAIIKPVECVETGVVYSSIKEAHDQTGVNISSLSEVLHGRQKRAAGYTWRLVKVVK